MIEIILNKTAEPTIISYKSNIDLNIMYIAKKKLFKTVDVWLTVLEGPKDNFWVLQDKQQLIEL